MNSPLAVDIDSKQPNNWKLQIIKMCTCHTHLIFQFQISIQISIQLFQIQSSFPTNNSFHPNHPIIIELLVEVWKMQAVIRGWNSPSRIASGVLTMSDSLLKLGTPWAPVDPVCAKWGRGMPQGPGWSRARIILLKHETHFEGNVFVPSICFSL